MCPDHQGAGAADEAGDRWEGQRKEAEAVCLTVMPVMGHVGSKTTCDPAVG